jgi:hypothetical protein
MKTDQLIDNLVSDVSPVSRHAVGTRLSLGIVVGALVSAAVVVVALGARPDLGSAMHGFAFWMKWSYTLSLSAIAIYATSRLARPNPSGLKALWLIAIPVTLLAGVGVVELVHTPSSEWLAMWLGRSWSKCPWLVVGLAMPIFVGLLWSFRRLAPTRLRAAGAAAGLAAGAFAATVYCLHCPEVSAIFVLTWYTLGILLAATFGALVGPRLLRW